MNDFKVTITKNGLPLNEIGGRTAQERTVLALAAVFEQTLQVAWRKAAGYGMAWQRQGYMGNLARIFSKADRLRELMWNDKALEFPPDGESTRDTLEDLVSIVAFAVINLAAENRWGDK